MRNVKLSIEHWEMKEPFTITGYTFSEVKFLCVTIEQKSHIGRGEATGVYYLSETAESMLKQAISIKTQLESGLNRQQLQVLLPPGGARNAIDCALWDLEAKITRQSVWKQTDIKPISVTTVNTIGVDTPKIMAKKAKTIDSSIIKVKLDSELSLERITAIRHERPEAEIIVDVNQGWTFDQLAQLAPRLKKLGVAMIEQPLLRGKDQELECYSPPIPLCADESCLDVSEFEQASKRYQMINIKLDKTGGLTEALDLANLARQKNMALMVGNMIGTSLAMAPGFVIAQLCQYVDLDGALFLKNDRDHGMTFEGGTVSIPSQKLWG